MIETRLTKGSILALLILLLIMTFQGCRNKQGDEWKLMFVMDYLHYDYA